VRPLDARDIPTPVNCRQPPDSAAEMACRCESRSASSGDKFHEQRLRGLWNPGKTRRRKGEGRPTSGSAFAASRLRCQNRMPKPQTNPCHLCPRLVTDHSPPITAHCLLMHCRGRDAGCPAPPHRSRRAVFPHRLFKSTRFRIRQQAGSWNSSSRWQRLSSRWQGIFWPFFSTMRGRGTWKRASIRLKAGQVRLWR